MDVLHNNTTGMKKGILKLSVKHEKDVDYLDIEIIKEIYAFLKADQEKCLMLLDIYDMNKQTPLIEKTVNRTRSIIKSYVDSNCKDEAEKLKVANEMACLSPFSALDNLIPTNTARNIVTNLSNQLTDDPTPLECESKDNQRQLDYIEKIMFDSSWEVLLKNCFNELVTMGISAICIKQTDKLESVYLENVPAYQCAFVMQGGNVNYSYFKSDTQLIIYTNKEIIEYTIDKEKWTQLEPISTIGGYPYLQPLISPKGKGIFENCLSDIAVYDMALYVLTHNMTDPKSSILNTSSNFSQIGYDGAKEVGSTKWIVKPTSDIIAICEKTRALALENIVDDTCVVTQKQLETDIKTATQSMELISKMNSLIKSTGNMFQQRMYPVLRILENLAVGLGDIKININVTFQEISNTYQKFELGKASLPLKEQYRMLGYNDEEERDILYKDFMQEILDKSDAEMGTQTSENNDKTTEIVEVDENVEQ